MEKRKMEACEPLDENLEKVELDVDDAQVSVVDGVIVGGDREEIKLLFFYKKPIYDACKAVVEFRVSYTRFQEIAREVNKVALALRGNDNTLNPMFR